MFSHLEFCNTLYGRVFNIYIYDGKREDFIEHKVNEVSQDLHKTILLIINNFLKKKHLKILKKKFNQKKYKKLTRYCHKEMNKLDSLIRKISYKLTTHNSLFDDKKELIDTLYIINYLKYYSKLPLNLVNHINNSINYETYKLSNKEFVLMLVILLDILDKSKIYLDTILNDLQKDEFKEYEILHVSIKRWRQDFTYLTKLLSNINKSNITFNSKLGPLRDFFTISSVYLNTFYTGHILNKSMLEDVHLYTFLFNTSAYSNFIKDELGFESVNDVFENMECPDIMSFLLQNYEYVNFYYFYALLKTESKDLKAMNKKPNYLLYKKLLNWQINKVIYKVKKLKIEKYKEISVQVKNYHSMLLKFVDYSIEDFDGLVQFMITKYIYNNFYDKLKIYLYHILRPWSLGNINISFIV